MAAQFDFLDQQVLALAVKLGIDAYG